MTQLHEMVLARTVLNSGQNYGWPKGHNHILFSGLVVVENAIV